MKDATAAEDIASEAFLKVWEKRQRLTDPGAIKGYLYTVVRNDCLNYLAKQKRMTAAAEAIGAGTEISEAAHLKAMIEAETIASLHRAINTLAPECRKVFSMMYIEGKTVREVASELGLAKSTVKAQKARGLVILKKRLGVINQ